MQSVVKPLHNYGKSFKKLKVRTFAAASYNMQQATFLQLQ